MKTRFLRLSALLLALVLLCAALGACANKGTPILSLTVDGKTYTYSVNLYEYQLATVKGLLYLTGTTVSGHTALETVFWESLDEFDGELMTLDEYYRREILKECRYVLISLYLFDLYDLSISEKEKEEIEEYLDEYVKSDGDGSENKLNSLLADYSINLDMFREHLYNAAKVNAVQNHLYGRLGYNIKDNYLAENYVHFEQLFFPKEEYVYMTDENGDIIYYNKTDNTVLYKKTDYPGDVKDGQTVYYTDFTKAHISYDEENGVRAGKPTSDGKGVETRKLSEEELSVLKNRAEVTLSQLQGASLSDFVFRAEEEDARIDGYDDGYYFLRDYDYSIHGESYAALNEITEKLKDAKTGDVVMVESEAGYHIVMKLEHTERAYEKAENQPWFEPSETGVGISFTDALTERVFLETIEQYEASITLDEAVFENVPSMKAVLPNERFY